MKTFKLICISLLALFSLCGCGHNRFNETKSWGVAFSIPFGDIGSLNVCVGSTETTLAMVRGGSSFETETIAGEGILAAAGGTAKKTTFKSNTQLNEGNIVKVMQSPEVPESAKLELAKSLADGTEAPDFSPSALQVREATLYSNGYTNELRYPFQTTGVDRAVDAVDHVATTVVDDATGAAKETASTVIDATRNTVNTISDHLNPGKKIKDAVIDASANLSRTVANVLLILIVLVIFILLFASRKSKRPVKHTGLKAPIRPDINEESTDAEFTSSSPLSSSEEPEVVELPDKNELNWFFKFWYGFLDVLRSLIFFWKDLSPEARDAVIDTGKKIFKKEEQKPKDPEESAE